MSCRSWWCGGESTVELSQAPEGAPVTLSCGCTVKRGGEGDETVPVTFASVACEAHDAEAPDQLPSGTPVQIDMLTAMLASQP